MKSLHVLTALAAFNFVSAQKTISLDNFKGIDIGEDMKVILVKSNENKLVTTNDDNDEVKVSNHN